MAPNKMTLTYFDGPGRAEISRLIMAYAGVDFEDKRIDFAEFSRLKPSLPYGQLPTLEMDGKCLCQSTTIARYLANKYNLTGHCAMSAAQADEVVDALNDMQGKLFPVYLALKDPAAAKEKLAEALKVCTPGFANLEKRLEARGGQFLAGNTLTWADLHLHVVTNLLVTCGGDAALAGCFKIKDLNSRVAALPNIKKWNDAHK
eukprot:TRINITY_DN9882_c0_g1_i2.p1 TRINITY_DN9882_c0_g1~~TRINITY_DN9882_c0_g1_i2.p1  ORF type:complete len:203 (-),score=66.83 TRINITY_DN9882_c0_g1_i2:48-656(-)